MSINKLGTLLLSDRRGLRIVLLALAATLTAVISASPALAQTTQSTEQQGESEDINQDFSVTSEGDNSNQCANVQGVANTGNSQNVISIEQYQGQVDDFEFEEVGSDITVSPESSAECNQRVNQAAAASASSDSCWTDSEGWNYCYWSGWGTYYWDPYHWDPVTGKYGTWVYWSPYPSWSTVSDVATGALGSAGGLTTLAVLATLGLAGTGLMIRRSRHG